MTTMTTDQMKGYRQYCLDNIKEATQAVENGGVGPGTLAACTLQAQWVTNYLLSELLLEIRDVAEN